MLQKLQNYFESVPDSHRLALLFGTLFIFWLIEDRKKNINNTEKFKHAKLNSLFMFTAAPVQLVFGISLTYLAKMEVTHHFGLLNYFSFSQNFFFQIVATFIILDFFEYVYHVIMHKIKILWMFHLVHHSDRVVDVSTTLREHPGETAARLAMSLLWVLISGASMWAIVFHQFIQIVSNIIAHSNVRLNEKTDKIVGSVFITPNLHQVHHHYKQPYTDSNYGDILSVWDHLFGTFRRVEVQKDEFGIDSCMDHEENSNFVNLIKLPFGKYRAPLEEKTSL